MGQLTPDRLWYEGHPLGLLLAPLGWLYCAVARLRALAYRRGWLDSVPVGVPVIVVGNLTVGGTGKTPLVIWLCDYLRRRGHRPGIASRGYGGSAAAQPTRVSADADPARVGDEPLLLVRRCRCPVVVGRDRVAAARRLVDELGCDLVISDDGLQHYRLRRDLEILVVDGDRRFGNGRCLPAGPLREPVARARRADLVILNGDGDGDGPRMRLTPGAAVSLAEPEVTRGLLDFCGSRVTAVAGIGHPQRFFAMLRRIGLDIDARPYPDHHRFSAADVAAWPPGPVLMTEKDAVKCIGLTGADAWYVPVDARPDAGFVTALAGHLGMIQSLVRA
jgi:tetraacyldisaccharide 4'-kinase